MRKKFFIFDGVRPVPVRLLLADIRERALLKQPVLVKQPLHGASIANGLRKRLPLHIHGAITK